MTKSELEKEIARLQKRLSLYEHLSPPEGWVVVDCFDQAIPMGKGKDGTPKAAGIYIKGGGTIESWPEGCSEILWVDFRGTKNEIDTTELVEYMTIDGRDGVEAVLELLGYKRVGASEIWKNQ